MQRPALQATILVALLLAVAVSLAAASGPSRAPRVHLYMDLSRAFDQALADATANKTIGTDASLEYLKQVAVQTRFLVRTQLELIRLHEQLLERLESGARPPADTQGRPRP